jgi:DNA-binding NarL/FixJ family response regulator
MAGGHSGTGLGMAFGVFLTAPSKPTPLEHKRWPQVATHLGAGLRLRAVARQLALDSAPVEAILEPGGKLHEAREAATGALARDTLREAVRRIERARTAAGRSDPDAAMQSWEGLVRGRWSIVDHFDTDGRRFVVAVKNDPVHHDPRGLSRRERQVAEYVGLGRSTKEIAYALGVSLSAVTNCTARAQAKLGLSSRAELAAFFAPHGLRTKLAETAIAGETLLIGAYPLVDERCARALTAAERDVVVHLVAGSTTSHVAQLRGVSERTVATQIQAIFRKLNVASRSELAVRLQATA